LGRFAGALSSTEVALFPFPFPFPFCREALGAIRVRIWMNGMAAERVWNPKFVGAKLRSRGFWGEWALKEEEKRMTGALPQEQFPV
jgi:hypothetical protein